jgi:hypothetical protein
MTAGPGPIMGWTAQHARHAAGLLRQSWNPAARVYESIGSDFFLALAPGWLNLGLWEGPGAEDEAEDACRRLVHTLAQAMTAGQIAAAAHAAGLAEVEVTACGDRVIAPALRLTAARLASPKPAPAGQQAIGRLLLRQVDLLWRRGIIDYLLVRAVRP